MSAYVRGYEWLNGGCTSGLVTHIFAVVALEVGWIRLLRTLFGIMTGVGAAEKC